MGADMLILGRVIAVLFGIVMFINAAFMLVSPKAWFGLPSWLRAQGTLRKEKYSSGVRAVEIQITGAVMIAVLVWVVYDFFSHSAG
jgi:hypothetical protein